MNVIFLDIDGVLNSDRTPMPTGFVEKYDGAMEAIDEENAKHLKRVMDKHPRLKIVLSTSWRDILELDVWNELFERFGIKNRIIGKTHYVSNGDGGRDQEILDFVRKNQVDRWLAIDDMTLELGMNFIRTSMLHGLTKDEADRAINHFKVH